ncbi:MAG: glycosyltransferase family 4 protein [Candidatus Aminicenantes bacterium]|nr:glycosyltransferase family 4 protein [Candidatus Aminicenantes bacterium]
MRIDQLIPAFHRGDAIGDTATHMKRFFLSQGFQSEIYCLLRDTGLESDSRLIDEFPSQNSSDICLLHFGLPSPLTKALIEMPGRKVIIYHNITPGKFFQAYSEEMARITDIGRKELKTLVPHVELALADSEYNRQELEDCGYKNTEVLPLFVDFSKYGKIIDRMTYDLYKDGRTNILFVGRVVPNKKIEDLIKVVFTYKKYVSPLVRLIVVGKSSSLPGYYKGLVQLADEFYLKPEEILFTGHIPDEEMFALYKASDVFLSLSEHEGFGLPFIESLVFDLPVIAYDCTAVSSTLDGAGILIKNKRLDYIAELIEMVTRDPGLRKQIIDGQRERLKRFKEMNLDDFLLKNLKGLLP